MPNFLNKLAEILEVDEVKREDVLEEFENWDSLTVLSIVATLDANYGLNLTSGDLKKVKTVGELADKISSHI